MNLWTEKRLHARQKSERAGRMAEWIAVVWLWCAGHRILRLRYKTPVGEIDLITARGRTVHMIEVKFRPDHASGLDAVTHRAQNRIRRAAEWFLSAHPKWQKCDLSFDVVTVTKRGLRYHRALF